MGLTQNGSMKRRLRPDFLHVRGAWQMHGAHCAFPNACPRRMKCDFHPLCAFVFLPGPISDFQSLLGLRLQITCLGTLETEFLPFVSLLRPLEFLSLESSQFFGCSWFADLHDFFVNYFKKSLKLLCFGKLELHTQI